MVVPDISIEDWLKNPYVKNRTDSSSDTGGFPRAIWQMFNEVEAMGIQNAVMQSGSPKRKTTLPGRGGQPSADLFVHATCAAGDIAMIVQRLTSNTDRRSIDKWLCQNKNKANRQDRLNELCEILEIDSDAPTSWVFGISFCTG